MDVLYENYEPEVGAYGLLTPEYLTSLLSDLCSDGKFRDWPQETQLALLRVRDAQHQADIRTVKKLEEAKEAITEVMQGPSLEEVKQVLKRMPESLQRDADYWIGQALEELFDKYPRSESEAVKAERERIIELLSTYHIHKLASQFASYCIICQIINQLREA